MSFLDWFRPASKTVPSLSLDTAGPAPQPIAFESERIRTEWQAGSLDEKLRRLVQEAAAFAGASGWQFLLTCLIRTPAENDACYGGHGDHLDGVHVRGRGADVRTRDQDALLVDTVVQFLNTKWAYDPERPLLKVALFEQAGPGSTGQHLHIQTHANTTLSA